MSDRLYTTANCAASLAQQFQFAIHHIRGLILKLTLEWLWLYTAKNIWPFSNDLNLDSETARLSFKKFVKSLSIILSFKDLLSAFVTVYILIRTISSWHLLAVLLNYSKLVYRPGQQALHSAATCIYGKIFFGFMCLFDKFRLV